MDKSLKDKCIEDINKLIETSGAMMLDLVSLVEQRSNKNKKNDHEEEFRNHYQNWYSESSMLIKQILPNRYDEFITLYKEPKRKKIDASSYSIQDWLNGLTSPTDYRNDKIFDDLGVMIMRFQTQTKILLSTKKFFVSALFDIKNIVQADFFDNEIDTAKELLKNGYIRASGVVLGVVLESHLSSICIQHNLSLKKKNPTINDYNETLKNNTLIDTANWRYIQRLGDLRNLCCHSKERDPTSDDVLELINGVEKIIKTLF